MRGGNSGEAAMNIPLTIDEHGGGNLARYG